MRLKSIITVIALILIMFMSAIESSIIPVSYTHL
mgnify:CR=1 FL=1